MSDYRLDVRLRNNRILSLIERAGYSTVMSFCSKHDISNTDVNGLICLRTPALRSDGSYRECVHRLADALGCNPEDLFTDRQARAALSPRASRVLDEREALSLCEPEVLAIADDRDMDAEIDRRKLLAECLDKLPPRERRVIERRWLAAEDSLETLAADGGVDGRPVSVSLMSFLERRAFARMRKHALQRNAAA